MKKTLLAVTLLASLGMASSVIAADLEVGGATLQWAGSVPAESVSGAGYWIVQDGGIGFTDGILTFKNDAAGIALNSSSEIGFKVVADALTTDVGYQIGVDIAPMNYKYTLTNVKVGVNGLATTQQPTGGYFAVHANGGAALVTAAEQTVTDKSATRLSIKAATGATATLASGDDVVVMAVVSVTPSDV